MERALKRGALRPSGGSSREQRSNRILQLLRCNETRIGSELGINRCNLRETVRQDLTEMAKNRDRI